MATATGPGAFQGFTPEALQFLADLAQHNDRAWFTPRKGEYERLLKEPLEALCVALADAFPRHGVPLDADPKRSPFRIHRDVRFSKDKSPYKTAASAAFRGPGQDMGGGYFHLEPGEIFIGGGRWHPEPAWLAAFRSTLDGDPDRIIGPLTDPAFVAEFGQVSGERLSRVPQGYAKDHPHAELLKHKDVTFGRRLADADVFSPDLPERIASSFAVATPVFRMLAAIGA